MTRVPWVAPKDMQWLQAVEKISTAVFIPIAAFHGCLDGRPLGRFIPACAPIPRGPANSSPPA